MPIAYASPLGSLLAQLRANARTPAEQGRLFECLITDYLSHEPRFHRLYSTVRSYAAFVDEHLPEAHGLSPGDKGIDLVATTHSGEHHAIQCKCYAPDHTLSKPDIDSFMAASGHRAFSERLLIDTTRKPLGSNAEAMLLGQSIPVTRIDLAALENSLIDWSRYTLPPPDTAQSPVAVSLKPRNEPRPHQLRAIADCLAGLAQHDRGQLIMACGSGKTFTALRIAEELVCRTAPDADDDAPTSASQNKNVLDVDAHILVLVPSLALLSQTLTEWTQQSRLALAAFAVCSDSEVDKGTAASRAAAAQDDRFRLSPHELAYPATTDAATLATEHAACRSAQDTTRADATTGSQRAARQIKASATLTVIFATYHSIDVIERAQKHHGLPPFDLAICDEAHRTTGQTDEDGRETHFVRIHAPDGIATRKRLYMTATPRIYSEESKRKTAHALIKSGAATASAKATPPPIKEPPAAPLTGGQRAARPINGSLTLYSMDDPATYGPVFHVLNFSSAVEQQLLVPYKVIVLAVHEADISPRIQSLLTDANNSLRLDDAAKIIGCFKALAKDGLRDLAGDDPAPMRRAVAFCQVVDRERTVHTRSGRKVAARQIAELFQHVVAEYQRTAPPEDPALSLRCEADYVHGGMDASQKTDKLDWLKAAPHDETRILTNVRCLSEGVDVPSLDAVLFLSPRNSQIEVVQAVGRVMRRAPGKTRGYIILPVVIPYGVEAHHALNDNQAYRVVWQVLRALKAHDDQFDQFVNRLELLGADPTKIEIIDTRELARRRRTGADDGIIDGQGPPPTGTGGHIGTDTTGPTPPDEPEPPRQTEFEIGVFERAVKAQLVKKLADRDHWEQWAADIGRLAQLHITRIRALLDDDASPPIRPPTTGDEPQKMPPPSPDGEARSATATRRKKERVLDSFDLFTAQLHRHINTSITREDIIEMLAQHLITRPVFDALFGSDTFSRNNPISLALETVTTQLLLRDTALDKEQHALDTFYADVRRRAAGITAPAARQKLIITLYDQFFATAFPRTVQKHGIVYTPLEVVDFILHSTATLLREHFGKALTSPDVQILDPFTGTGTFLARLLASPDLIPDAALPHVYAHQLHATEILLLPYYIAAINIESTYAQRIAHATPAPDGAKRVQDAPAPFTGILLADTFNIPPTRTGTGDLVEDLTQHALAANDARRRRQIDSPITVILGNPPYSIGQKTQNDNNPNIAYPLLDARIAETYAAESQASSKKSLRDSYIRALRWASDRLSPETGGLVAFVTNAGWLDSAASNGLRKCLTAEFSHLYIYNLRGDQRTQGERSRREGGKIFGSGSRAPIAISILVKTPKTQNAPAATPSIAYADIGDYLSREAKLEKLTTLGSTAGLAAADLWQHIKPDAHGDWLNQRRSEDARSTAALLPLGDPKHKNKPTNTALFHNYSLGVATGRDPWCNNPSRTALLTNVEKLVAHYEAQRTTFAAQYPSLTTKQRQDKLPAFIDTAPTKISWSSSLLDDFARDKPLAFHAASAVPTLYRPFTRGWLYYNRRLNERTYQMPEFFPLPTARNDTAAEPNLFVSPAPQPTPHENRLICVTGIGAKTFSTLMVDTIPSLDTIEKGQCFPLYRYAPDGTRHSGIGEAALGRIRSHYGEDGAAITPEEVFYYTYGLLHSPEYRTHYAANLLKELPRLPLAATYAEFQIFEKIGRELGDLHCGYDRLPLSTLDEYGSLEIHKKGAASLDDLAPADFYVEKMKYGRSPEGAKDLTTIHYNRHLTLKNIPRAAHDYTVNGRSPLDWALDRQCVKTDKPSGLVSDANAYATETRQNPRYPLELLLRLITLSLRTQRLLTQLPKLEF